MRLRIRGRLYALVALFGLGCAVLAATLIWLQYQRLLETRVRSLEALADSAIGVLESHRKLAQSGVMTEDEAKTRALTVIGDMRYGNGDYFVVFGITNYTDPVM